MHFSSIEPSERRSALSFSKITSKTCKCPRLHNSLSSWPTKLAPNRQANLHEYDTELASLRIALKAIEVQCPPPSNMDEDLRRSIQKWKADWKSVKEKRASRSLRESSFLSSAPATPR